VWGQPAPAPVAEAPVVEVAPVTAAITVEAPVIEARIVATSVDTPASVTPVVEASATPALTRRSRRASRPVSAPVEPVEPFELLEPEAVPAPVSEVPVAAEQEIVADAATPAETLTPTASEPTAFAADEASVIDEFEAAARLFSFTGETPVQAEAIGSEALDRESADDESDQRDATPHIVSRGTREARRAIVKRVAATSFSVGVMGIVGLLTVGMTTPAEAVAAVSGIDNPVSVVELAAKDTEEEEIQAYVAPVGTESAEVARTESYSTTTVAELARESGIRNFSNFFVNDPNSAIQWPFAVGVPISYGYGWRSGRMHEGVDFTPGNGSPIQSIAEGTVRVASNAGGAYGAHVIVDHIIDGELISSHYAHMQYGTIAVSVGQKVEVGTTLGLTGNTGRSYGAHLHFELLAGGTTPIDPIPWLRQHAGG
jgi:murein DD-endopeptidase MepM/ murein hydrolase activator NlpD